MARAGDIRAGRAFVELSVREGNFVRGIKAGVRTLARFGKAIGAVGLAVAFLSLRQFAKFDDAMRQVQAVTQSSISDFLRLTETAKLLGRTTSFTAVEVASLMVELGRGGFSPVAIEKMTGAVLNLARATGTDAAEAAGVMSATIRQFGLDAKDSGHVADALTITANKSFNTIESLAESLKFAGPVAADFNMSMEDTLALLGALGNIGIKGSLSGTALKRLLTISAAEAPKLKKIFKVNFLDAAGDVRPLVDTLDEVREATKDLGSGDRGAKFFEAFGLRGLTAASAIGKAAGSIRDLSTAIKGSEGAAKRAADAMDAGIGGSFRLLRSAVEGVALTIGAALSNIAQTAMNNMTNFFNSVVDLWNVGELGMLAKLGMAQFAVGIRLGWNWVKQIWRDAIAALLTEWGSAVRSLIEIWTGFRFAIAELAIVAFAEIRKSLLELIPVFIKVMAVWEKLQLRLKPSPGLKAAQDKAFEAQLQKNQVDQRVAGGENVPQHIRDVTNQDYERAIQELRDAENKESQAVDDRSKKIDDKAKQDIADAAREKRQQLQDIENERQLAIEDLRRQRDRDFRDQHRRDRAADDAALAAAQARVDALDAEIKAIKDRNKAKQADPDLGGGDPLPHVGGGRGAGAVPKSDSLIASFSAAALQAAGQGTEQPVAKKSYEALRKILAEEKHARRVRADIRRFNKQLADEGFQFL